MRRLRQEEFEKRLYAVCPSIEAIEPYSRMKDKILFQCKECGNEWRTTPSSVLAGTGCPNCSRERVAKRNRKTHDEFVVEVADKNPSVEVIGSYRNGNAKISVRCKVCGNEWNVRAQSLLKGYGCWQCGKRKIGDALRKTHEEFVLQVATINPNIEVLGKYRGDAKRVPVRCRVCGNEWSPTAGGLVAGHGCTHCGKTSTSLTEQFILQGLRIALGDEQVLHRDRSAIGVELDIFIPRYHIAIEPGGWHWHRDKLEIDKAKRDLCTDNGIQLLVIYDNYKESEPPFSSDCLTFPFKLSAERGHATLKRIVTDILSACGAVYGFTDDDWVEVLKRARKRSVRLTTTEFVKKLSRVNDRVIVKGKYLNNHTPIRCECPTCGWSWSATPAHLLSGEACPSCAGTMKRTHESFVSMLAERKPTIEVIGRYSRAADRVEVKCRKCGHIWSPTANSLQQGRACPKCAAELRGNNRRLTEDEFRIALKNSNPSVDPIGPYHNGVTPMQFACRLCGAIWEQEPRMLLYYNGYGCPVCTGRYHGVTSVKHTRTLNLCFDVNAASPIGADGE